MKNNNLSTNINFHLSDLKTILPLQIEVSNNRIRKIQLHQIDISQNIQVTTDCDPKQATIPYPDKFQTPDILDVHLTQIIAIENHYKCSIPDFARFIRVLFLELSRLLNHYNFFVALGRNIQFPKLQHHALKDRQKILELFDFISHKQAITRFFNIGGITRDLPVGFIENLDFTLLDLEKRIHFYEKKLTATNLFTDLLTNIGIVPQESAIRYQFSGPNLRASLEDSSYDHYQENELYKDVESQPLLSNFKKGTAGDSWQRCWIRFLEIEASIHMIRQVVKLLIATEVKLQNIPAIPRRDNAFSYQFEGLEGMISCTIIKSAQDYCLTGKHQPAIRNLIPYLDEIVKNQRISSLPALLSSFNLNTMKFLMS